MPDYAARWPARIERLRQLKVGRNSVCDGVVAALSGRF
jgi:hypothetical protein